MRFSGDEETAKDVVQEAFIKALLKKDIIKYMDVDKIKSWIYVVAKNLLIDKKRREQNYKRILENNFLDYDSAQINESYHIDNKFILESTISNLAKKYKDVVTLKYFLGLNSSEISKQLNISTSTVRSRLQKAVELLKNELE